MFSLFLSDQYQRLLTVRFLFLYCWWLIHARSGHFSKLAVTTNVKRKKGLNLYSLFFTFSNTAYQISADTWSLSSYHLMVVFQRFNLERVFLNFSVTWPMKEYVAIIPFFRSLSYHTASTVWHLKRTDLYRCTLKHWKLLAWTIFHFLKPNTV